MWVEVPRAGAPAHRFPRVTVTAGPRWAKASILVGGGRRFTLGQVAYGVPYGLLYLVGVDPDVFDTEEANDVSADPQAIRYRGDEIRSKV